MSQASETIEALDLLQKTLDYLYRLPVVPTTHALCKEIEGYLADPGVVSAKRAALHLERMQSARVAQCFDPGGQVLLDIVVTADDVTCRLPRLFLALGQNSPLMEQLHDGLTIKLNKLAPEF